jgi:hypothetical protein|eukprot:COSAG01_NODE_3552_length_5942_cov_20.267842_5_plen_43_part_00
MAGTARHDRAHAAKMIAQIPVAVISDLLITSKVGCTLGSFCF